MAIEDNQQARVLAVVNRKGGVGKTTTAINLAHGLSRKLLLHLDPRNLDQISDAGQLYQYGEAVFQVKGHVLLIDLDPQGHCNRALGVDAQGVDVGEVLLGRQHLSQAVISADRADDGYPRPNLWILPSSDRLETAIESLQKQSLEYVLTGHDSQDEWMIDLLERRFDLVRRRFTFIILDCAPGLDLFSRAVHQFAKAVIVPVKPDYLSMAGTGQNIGYIQAMQQRGASLKIHTILPTFCMDRQRLDREMVARLKQSHGDLVGEPIPRTQLVAEAPAQHLTIFEVDPGYDNGATIAYQKLVDRVYDGEKFESRDR